MAVTSIAVIFTLWICLIFLALVLLLTGDLLEMCGIWKNIILKKHLDVGCYPNFWTDYSVKLLVVS